MRTRLGSIPYQRLQFVVLIAAIVIRLCWGVSRPTSDAALAQLPDQNEYLAIARSFLHGQHGLSFVDPRFGQRVYAFRMPGYPLFIAACGGHPRTVRIAQAVLDTSTVLAAYLLSRTLLHTRSAAGPVLASLLVALNPLLIYFSALLLSETLFVALLVWGMVLLLWGLGSGGRAARPLVWLAGGVLLSLTVLVRPSGIALPVALAIAALWVNYRRDKPYQSSTLPSPTGWWPLPVGATMVLLLAAVLTPWMLRNYALFHRTLWTDTNAGLTLYDGYNPQATGASDQRFVKQMPYLASMDEIERSEFLSQRAREFIARYPKRALELATCKVGRTWSPIPLSDQFGRLSYRLVLLAYSLPLFLLALMGLWRGGLERSAKGYLLLPAIYLTVVHALTIGSLRYRLPAEPLLAVLAASALYRGPTPWRRAGAGPCE